MSLINQMLQELDARGGSAAGGGILQGQVRVVAERRAIHPAWWIALVLTLFLLAAAAWIWLGRAGGPTAAQKAVLESAEMQLKLAADLTKLPATRGNAAREGRIQPAVPPPPAQLSSAQPTSGGNVTPPPAAVMPTSPTVAMPPLAAILPPVEKKQSEAAHAIASPAVLPSAAVTVAATQASSPPAASAAANTAKAAAVPPVRSAVAPSAEVPASPAIAKQVKELTATQRAENEYRKGSALVQQGRIAEAIGALEIALQLDGQHAAARQTLVALLLEGRRTDDAMRRLREGLHLDPAQSGLAMILARLQVERGDLKPAIETLQRAAVFAGDRADFHAFFAALLQRDLLHKEAVEHYALALKKAPQNGIWWMGLGISLQAENRSAEAIEAYSRARASSNLSAELKAFVEERLSSLQR